jgi:hypothetical protein
VKRLTHLWRVDGIQSSARGAIHSALFDDMEEVMYETAAIARKSSGDFTIVLTFSLLGLALSLFVIGTPGMIDPEAMANLFLSF